MEFGRNKPVLKYQKKIEGNLEFCFLSFDILTLSWCILQGEDMQFRAEHVSQDFY